MVSGTTWASARALSIHREVVGPDDGPVVLLLHGLTASRRYWVPRVYPLAARYRLIVPDLPGFGLSPKPLADYWQPPKRLLTSQGDADRDADRDPARGCRRAGPGRRPR